MKKLATLLFAVVGISAAQEPERLIQTEPTISAAADHEQAGVATIRHRDEVLHDRSGSKHLWPLLNTPEARMNYFEVTSRGTLHYHPDADHRLYVLDGSLLVTCGTKTTRCVTGDFIVIPRGVRHCYDVVAPGEKALLLTFDAPPYDPKKTVNLEPKGAGK